MRDGKPAAPPRTLRLAHQVRPGGRWALPPGEKQQPNNNIDMVETGLYLHSSTLVDTYIMIVHGNYVVGSSRKSKKTLWK